MPAAAKAACLPPGISRNSNDCIIWFQFGSGSSILCQCGPDPVLRIRISKILHLENKFLFFDPKIAIYLSLEHSALQNKTFLNFFGSFFPTWTQFQPNKNRRRSLRNWILIYDTAWYTFRFLYKIKTQLFCIVVSISKYWTINTNGQIHYIHKFKNGSLSVVLAEFEGKNTFYIQEDSDEDDIFYLDDYGNYVFPLSSSLAGTCSCPQRWASWTY